MITQRLTRNLFTGTTEPLTAPLSRDFTEDLGDGRTETFLNKFQGAEAAFSLRSLGTYNDPVVRVRRAADNDERDFSAGQVQGELADWVNGKLDTTLPCDIPANPQDINGFTASGVSGFIDGVYSTNPSFPTSNGRIKVDLDTNSSVVIGWTGSQWLWEDNDEGDTYWTSSEDETYPWDVTSWTKGPDEVPESTGPVFSNFEGGRFDNSPVAAYSLREVKDGYSGNVVRVRRESDDVEVDVALDANKKVSTSSAISNVTESPDQGDTTATTLGEFLTEGGNQDAFVATWYDQEGSNDATQGTAASQPKIAEGGSLLTEGVGFDGVDDFMNITGLDSAFRNIGNAFLFAVYSHDSASVTPPETVVYANAGSGVGSPRLFLGSVSGDTSAAGLRLDSDSFVQSASAKSSETKLRSANFDWSGGDVQLFENGVGFTAATFSSGSGLTSDTDNSPVTIGKFGGVSYYFEGKMEEIIIYDSDQSANRFKIESNINNHYGIYTAAEDGFVNTWYDQSGNSNDAVATADANEPEIVNAGSLFAGGIDFDGIDDFMVTENSDLCNLTELSLFTFLTPFTGAAERMAVSAGGVSSSSTIVGGWILSFNGNTDTVSLQTQSQFSTATSGAGSNVTSNESVITSILNIPNGTTSVNGTEGTTNTSMVAPLNTSFSSLFRRRLRIGCQHTFQPTNHYQGPIKEVILYASDQSANRTAIESNIANRYGITLP